MFSIKKYLFSLALVVAAFSSQNQHLAAADLTPHNVEYDAMAAYMMASLDELKDSITTTKDTALIAKYAPVVAQLKQQATAGTLTAVQFACVVDEIYPLSDSPFKDFVDFAVDFLDAAENPTVEFTGFAAPFYSDFVTATMSTVAGSIKNTKLSAQVAAFKTQLEKDITNKVSPQKLEDKILAFYEEADELDDTILFSATVGATARKRVSNLLAELKANKKCGAATPSPAVTTAKPMGPGTGTTTTSPSTATPKPNATTTTTTTMAPTTTTTSSPSTPSTTELPTDDTIQILSPETAAPPGTLVQKSNITTAAPAKSQSTTVASSAVSVLTLAVVLAIATVF